MSKRAALRLIAGIVLALVLAWGFQVTRYEYLAPAEGPVYRIDRLTGEVYFLRDGEWKLRY